MVMMIPMSAQAQKSEWVESTLASMTPEEKVGQLFIADLVAVYSNRQSPNFRLAEEFVQRYHVAGFVLAGGTVSDIALMTNALQRESKIPLIINADLEGGLWFNHPYIWQRGRAAELPRFVGGGGTPLPSCMAIGATGNPRFAYEFGTITAREARAVGIHWTNSPVSDVNSNPNNPIINTRSFGENPAEVARMVEAYVKGAQDQHVLATLKHFPGHGDTEEDTHMKLPMLPFDRARLDSVEFVPFKAGITAGAKAVMTAHIALPAIDPQKRPSTLSPIIITDLLRRKLGFEGIVVTDGMTMQGVTDHYSPAEAAVQSIEAGVDAVLVPADFAQAYQGVLAALQSGRLTQARIDQSVRKILAAKAWVGLDQDRLVNVENISNVVGSPESEVVADSMFAASITLLRNTENIIPLAPQSRVHIVTVTDDPSNQMGEALAGELQRYAQSVTLSHLWNDLSKEAIGKTSAEARSADIVMVGIYLSVGSWKGELGFSADVQKFFDSLTGMHKPVVVIAFGDPYVLGKIPATDGVIAAYTGLRKSEEAVARVLGGASEAIGKLPVTIPGRYKRGEGIHLSPKLR
jgi:beta-glucosidase-like glycosyl hydrolase